ncbi:hypothetical protein, partial [Ancylobacter lacus]|uniref:hypothetical protein n=1 Tax=Ancylobacter lacus TaxID=2579970 RepID=UPI001BD158AD
TDTAARLLVCAALLAAIVAAIASVLNAELARRGHSFRSVPALPPAKGRFRDTAQIHGFGAGLAVDINAPVTGGSGPAGLLGFGDRS